MTTLTRLAQFNTGGDVLALELNVDGMLLASNVNPELYFLRLNDLVEIRSIKSGLSNMNVIISSADGNFFAVGSLAGYL